MSWHKRDDDYWTSPKIALAGEDAALVFDVLLGINNRRKRRGKLLPEDLALELIQIRLGCARRSLKQISRALDRCELAELLVFDDQQGAEIVGYDEDWAPRPRNDGQQSNPTPPVESEPASADSDRKCSRCGKRTNGAKRCAACADKDARRDRRSNGAGSGAGVAQIGADCATGAAQGLAQGLAQVGAGVAQAAPRAGASDSEIESEKEKEKPARPLNGTSKSTNPRAETWAGGPEVPTGRGSQAPEPDADGPDPEFRILPGETKDQAVVRIRNAARALLEREQKPLTNAWPMVDRIYGETK